MKLTPTQKKIIEKKGNLIVRASAGTGKTHTMVTKISQELKDNETHKAIAAITFTIKAAQEIKDRLSIDVSQQFIGTNNSFVIEEIIKPFMKDVYGEAFDVDIDKDYTQKTNTFEEGLDELKFNQTLCSYEDNRKNFVFELANKIVNSSLACQYYLKSKYFKIYIDEYQDCDEEMHNFFMYLCDNLNIETFIVGDEKQSIYMWRGAYPQAFTSIWEKENFSKIFMGDNFRSCKQIQNYTNLLCDDTRHLYSPSKNLSHIIWINTHNREPWSIILNHIDKERSFALLRFSNKDAKDGALSLSKIGFEECVYIPQTPIADITTECAWLYLAIANYYITETYSAYDLISEMPVEADESQRSVSQISKYLKSIATCIEISSLSQFEEKIKMLANYLGYVTKDNHIKKLYETIVDTSYHVAFKSDEYKHVSITFHSSKGLEFDQVVIFTDDYRLNDSSSIYNHYVASSRAKNKLIIVKNENYNANLFEANLSNLLKESNIEIEQLVTII